ncbi:hypothetical protein BaRGS_00038615 [Batillaria attramentaria]|uniref:Uncharacterized protein n=1 Tax=Batillaria attramentaria TaxID=370345 RepID=A0ABD0J5K6_9CAEN
MKVCVMCVLHGVDVSVMTTLALSKEIRSRCRAHVRMSTMLGMKFLLLNAAFPLLYGCAPSRTQGGILALQGGSEPVKDDNSSDRHLPLLCGKFSDRGTPPLVPNSWVRYRLVFDPLLKPQMNVDAMNANDGVVNVEQKSPLA